MQHADVSPNSSWIPFTLQAGQEQPKMNIQRIIEALLIAAITGGVAMYATVQVLDTRLENMQRDVQRLEQSVNRMQDDFYKPANGSR